MRLLVTGVSGLVGSNLARLAAGANWDVTGTFHHHEGGPPGIACHPLDLGDGAAAAAMVDRLRPDAIVHAAAMARPDECGRQPQLCRQVNVEGTRALARAAAAVGARLAYLSSDLVYGDQHGELSEDGAVPAPLGVYAASKLDGEQAALEETSGRAFVARTALVYGWGTQASVGFLREWVEELRAGRPVRAFTDQLRCPTYVEDLCRALLDGLQADQAGVYNVAGPLLCSRYEFAIELAQAFDLDQRLVEPCSMDDFGFDDPRPHQLHLPNTKLQAAIPYAPLAPEAGLAQLAAK